MILDELVEGVELDDPQEVLAVGVAEHLEVLNRVLEPAIEAPRLFCSESRESALILRGCVFRLFGLQAAAHLIARNLEEGGGVGRRRRPRTPTAAVTGRPPAE